MTHRGPSLPRAADRTQCLFGPPGSPGGPNLCAEPHGGVGPDPPPKWDQTDYGPARPSVVSLSKQQATCEEGPPCR